ncbi:BCL2 associated agonist of cell death b [Aplochiton taeniatus]
MASFTISDSESEPSDDLNDAETGSPTGVRLTQSLTVPQLRLAGGGRMRVNSENLPGAPAVDGVPEDDGPFRGRSQSAPPALWAAKKYGRQLRRMSDEFDTLLDKGMKRVRSDSSAKQMHLSPSWWNYLFSHQETEGESNHLDTQGSGHRNE